MARILLVEQDDQDAERIRDALAQRRDWEIIRVSSVLDAIRTAGETPFDAAVLDDELPDGEGMDLLDFLRIGSPGIRILMVSRNGNEAKALQALSHGAGDWLVKDTHLPLELPRRMDALLDHVDARAAFVETLRPSEAAGDVHDDVDETASVDARRARADAALATLLSGGVFAGAVYDARGHVIAARLVQPLDPDGLGFALATLHAQVGALWTTTELKPLSYLALVQVEGGLLALTAVQGPFLVALLMAQATPAPRALRLLDEGARRVRDALAP